MRSVLRRQPPLLLLVGYPEDAGVAGGERREQILEVAHLGSGADRNGVGVPGLQDRGRQLGAIIRVDLMRSRIGVDERKNVRRLDLKDGCLTPCSSSRSTGSCLASRPKPAQPQRADSTAIFIDLRSMALPPRSDLGNGDSTAAAAFRRE